MSRARTKILLRFDGGGSFGMGHSYRCWALADFLLRRYHARCYLAVKHKPVILRRVSPRMFPFIVIPSGLSSADEAAWLAQIGARQTITTIVLDILDTTTSYVRKLRNAFNRIVTFDDRGPGALETDCIIHMLTKPPLAQLRWKRRETKLYFGPRFVLIREEFLRRRRTVIRQLARHFVISIGGTDVSGLSTKVARALVSSRLCPRVTLICAPLFRHHRALAPLLRRASNSLRVVVSPTRIAPILYRADVAVVSGGMGPYETAAMGLPTVALCQTEAEWHKNTLSDYGFTLNLGVGTKLSTEKIRLTLEHLALDRALRRRLSRAARRTVDGRGLERVARIIMASRKTK